ncbi:glycosyltransferase family 2 protein [uncultured Jannaschia sp.]|uniref:glycosyltransferase family 2 protein n=1 Tax=uncultured Jannaschia sp. TaxID=293347 RepID=UPI00261A406D|nr:glycosyltransferase family 2 protein [uncultured Jannaschia sp.]
MPDTYRHDDCPGPEVEISVIVPVFNEEESVWPLYRAITEALTPMWRSYEILLVDDGSRDATIARARDIVAADARVSVLRFRRNYGQTAAMTAGIEHARGKYLVTMDGDLQNDPADIPMMVAKLEEGNDLVVGWREKRQDKWLSRKLPSMIANRLIGRVTGIPIRDNGCSLKVYRADVIKRVPLYSDMHRFIPAMTIPLGARVEQVPVRHHARQFGASKYGLSRIFKVMLDLITVKSLLVFARRPVTTFSGFAFACLVAAAMFLVLLHDGGEHLVVEMAVFGLLASLSVFIFLIGVVVAVIFQTKTFSMARFDTSLEPRNS